MKKIGLFFIAGFCAVLGACDLQPKIMSLPDSVGDFISTRYPALLADPETQPEIYNSAATDYGVYASPELYGRDNGDDYVMYASIDDYIVPPSLDAASQYGSTDNLAVSGANLSASPDATVGGEIVYYSPDAQGGASAPVTDDVLRVPVYGGGALPRAATTVTVARGDTLYSLAKKYNTSVDELANMNSLSAPFALSVGQKIKVPGDVVIVPEKTSSVTHSVARGAATTTRVELSEIKVGAGDTLYSMSRKYSIPVNDLAVMNNLSAPFTLSIGQTLKVPNLKSAPVRMATQPASVDVKKSDTVSIKKTPTGTTVTSTSKKTTKSEPVKKLPSIGARSSSKFSWPVRGTILSHFGAKSNGLFNDGINVSAARGTTVAAAENGVVAYAGNEVKGMGNLIIVQHADGWMTVYAHMDSLSVKRGTKVSVGQKIGTVGATGKVDKPQLHFEIRKGTKAYNPSSYLKK